MCEYDKNIAECLYQTKDTESHEDSDFCYGWGRNMTNCVNCGAPIETDKKVCPYCKTPYGLRTKIELEPYIDSNGRICRHEPEMIEVTTLEDCEHRFIRK